MNKNDKKIAEILIKIGQCLRDNPDFINQLDAFLNAQKNTNKSEQINLATVASLDLFQLIREEAESKVEERLLNLNIKELRELLKKYRFGSSSKIKTEKQIVDHIMNQLRQRKIDVFQSPKNENSNLAKSDNPAEIKTNQADSDTRQPGTQIEPIQ